jgi:GAF domain-containing protein
MHGQLAREFAQVACRLRGQVEIKEILGTMADLASISLRCDHLGLILRTDDGQLADAGATDLLVADADCSQLELGEGPCWSCLAGAGMTLVSDTSDETRWPDWTNHAAQLGFRSTASVRLSDEGVPLGALTLYSERPAAFDDSSLPTLATHAATAVARSRAERVRPD